MTIPGDNPIKAIAQDGLNRSGTAIAFAEEVLLFDRTEGLVVAVLGPWGSGKTSFVNMAKERLATRGATLLEFNPWMFSGADQLVDSFFLEISAQLKVRPGLEEAGKALEEYGEAFAGLAWLPFVGAWLERIRLIGKASGKLLQRRKEGIANKRERIRDALSSAGMQPIIVTLDDIDRLTTVEIREVFKLVRLTASFPNVIYLLAFDRVRVESALGEESIPGRDYMEKILQLAIDLPVLPLETLQRQTLAALDDALTAAEWKDSEDEDRWLDTYFEIVAPLVRNIRDVRRYAASVRSPALGLAGHLSLSDVLGLEAVRTFLPDVFTLLHQHAKVLTQTAPSWHGDQEDDQSEEVKAILEAAGDRRPVAESMIRRLFPAAEVHLAGPTYNSDWKPIWLKAGRVAHEDNLRLYLERVANASLDAFRTAQKVFSDLDDQTVARSHFIGLSDDEVGAVAEATLHLTHDLPPERATPLAVAYLNVIHRLTGRRTGYFGIPQELIVVRIVKNCMAAVPDAERLPTVKSILAQVHTHFGQLILLHLVGQRKGVGLDLIEEAEALALEKDWRRRVREAPLVELVNDGDARRVALAAMETGPGEGSWVPPDDVAYTVKLFRSSVRDATGQVLGHRKVFKSARLYWDSLVKILGNENVVEERLDEVRAFARKGNEDLIELIEKYLSGWRPKED